MNCDRGGRSLFWDCVSVCIACVNSIKVCVDAHCTCSVGIQSDRNTPGEDEKKQKYSLHLSWIREKVFWAFPTLRMWPLFELYAGYIIVNEIVRQKFIILAIWRWLQFSMNFQLKISLTDHILTYCDWNFRIHHEKPHFNLNKILY